MAEFVSRAKWERKLARELSDLLERHNGRLLEILGDPPDLTRLSPEVWDEIRAELGDVLEPSLEQMYVESAVALSETMGIPIVWDLINVRAANWASNYSFKLVAGIADTSRAGLQRIIGDFYTQRQNLGQLASAILTDAETQELWEAMTRFSGPQRAQMIAITETTRAAVEGQAELVAQIEADGGKMIPIWETRMDEKAQACIICWPRQGQPRGSNWYERPPAHPNCRCGVRYVPVFE